MLKEKELEDLEVLVNRRKKMNKLYMMIGLPASGKSTIAKELSKSEEAIVVSSDEIRKELNKDKKSKK